MVAPASVSHRDTDAASAATRVGRVGSFKQGPQQHRPLVLSDLPPVHKAGYDTSRKEYQKDHKGTSADRDIARLVTWHRAPL